MGKHVLSRAAVTCWHLSADRSAIETVTNGRCLRIWRSGHGEEQVTETEENYLMKTSKIYVLGHILGRWRKELREGLFMYHAKSGDKCTGSMRRASRVARQGKWDVYKKFQSRNVCDRSQWYLSFDGMIILKWIIHTFESCELMCFRIQSNSSCRPLWTCTQRSNYREAEYFLGR
jgi:hypothetical protein